MHKGVEVVGAGDDRRESTRGCDCLRCADFPKRLAGGQGRRAPREWNLSVGNMTFNTDSSDYSAIYGKNTTMKKY